MAGTGRVGGEAGMGGSGGASGELQSMPGAMRKSTTLCRGDERDALIAAGIQGHESSFGVAVDSDEPNTPMTAGRPYAISWSVRTGTGAQYDLELWGAMGACSTEMEMLWKGLSPTGSEQRFCESLMPGQNYTHIHYVTRKAAEGDEQFISSAGFQYCPDGTCPAQ